MLPLIPKPPISHRRKALALTIAGAADLLQIVLFPLFVEGGASPFDDAIDVVTAILLTAVCGFKWQFVLAFFMELVPGLDLLPTWSAVALLIPSAPNTIEVYRTDRPASSAPSAELHPPIEVKAIAVPPAEPSPKEKPWPTGS